MTSTLMEIIRGLRWLLNIPHKSRPERAETTPPATQPIPIPVHAIEPKTPTHAPTTPRDAPSDSTNQPIATSTATGSTATARTTAMTKDELVAIARERAAAHGLDGALVCAVCEQESAWNEYATRIELAFIANYLFPLPEYKDGTLTRNPTELYFRATSWGLMQVLGQVAREFGFTGTYLSELCAPYNSLEFGCRKLRQCMDRKHLEVHAALQKYNGGGNAHYADEVLQRVDKYKEAT